MVCACVSVGGCDFLRKVAGRPTSAQIEAEVERRAEQERVAEVERQQKLEAERDSIRRAQEAQVEAPAEVQAVATQAGGRYYVVVGAYQDRHNAEKKKQRLEAAGYTAVIFTVRDGLKAVAAGPSATRDQAAVAMAGLRRRGLCPEDGWILKLD